MVTGIIDRSRRVLLAASDPETREQVRAALETVPLALAEAKTGREGLEQAEQAPPDLILVDMQLEDMTGLGLCRLIRERRGLAGTPIVLLSAFDHEIDRILAFETGADDFVAKPFYRRELASRLGAILRRTDGPGRGGGPPALRAASFQLDPERGLLEVEGRRVDLTPKELEVLSVLVRNVGRVLSRERIVTDVWGRRSGDPRVVDAHIKSIRRKLGDASHALQTVRGVGFRFAPREGGAGDTASPHDAPGASGEDPPGSPGRSAAPRSVPPAPPARPTGSTGPPAAHR